MNRPLFGSTLILAMAVLSCNLGCSPTSNVSASPSTQLGSKPADGSSTPTTEAGAQEKEGTAPNGAAPGKASSDPETKPVTTDASVSETTQAGGGPGTGDSVTLRFAMAKGSEYKFMNTTSATQELPRGPSGKASAADKPVQTSADTLVKVVDSSENSAKVELTVSKMQISGGPSDPRMKDALEKASKDSQGVKVSVNFDQYGKPSGIQYLKGDRTQAMAAGIDSNTGFFGLTYPENAVKLGDSWSHSYDFKDLIGAFGPMPGANWKDPDVKTVFTLKSFDAGAGIAVISISSKGSPSMTMKMPSQSGKGTEKVETPKEMTLSFKVDGTGTATIDLKTGVPKLVEYSMSTEFKTPMGNGKQSIKATLKRA